MAENVWIDNNQAVVPKVFVESHTDGKCVPRDQYDAVLDVLLDVLNQACGDGDGEIDNRCISTYEDATLLLKEEGLLEEVNSRIFNIVEIGYKKPETPENNKEKG